MDEELSKLQREVSADASFENVSRLYHYYQRIGKKENPIDLVKAQDALKKEALSFFDDSLNIWTPLSLNEKDYWVIIGNRLYYWPSTDLIITQVDFNDLYPHEIQSLEDFIEDIRGNAYYSCSVEKRWEKNGYCIFECDQQTFVGSEYIIFDIDKRINLSELFEDLKEKATK